MTTPSPATVASALTSDKIHLPAASLSRVTPNSRSKAADRGEAMKDGSYPIRDAADLRRAVNAFGRAKDKGAAKRHIIRRAKALDKVDVLPESWKVLALKEFPGDAKLDDVQQPSHSAAPSAVVAAAVLSASPLDDALAVKADRHNSVASADRLVSVAKLKAVYRRGESEYTSRPCVTASQYAHARVNAFLRLLASDTLTASASPLQDADLLPAAHPQASPPFAVRPYGARA